MENAALIDVIDEPGVACSVSVIPLAGRGRSSLSSAGLSPPCEPAGNNPAGSGGKKAALASGEPVGATMPSGSHPAAAAATTDEVVSKLDLAIMGCAICLLVPIALNIGGLTLSWVTLWKVLYGSLTVVSIVLTIAAFLTAWCPAIEWARTLSPSCARFSLISAAALFVVFTACRLARFGCVVGVAAAAVVVVILAVVWVLSKDPPAIDAAAADEDVPASLPADAP